MSVYVCGDTHLPIDIAKLNKSNWKIQDELSKDDVLIVLGDFGLLWEQSWSKEELYWAKWLTKKNYTVCFIDGNHENFDRVNAIPVTNFYGADAGVAYSDDNGTIYHLKRGQVYEMCGKKILTIGGATSVDKDYRTPYISWWPEETLSMMDEIFIDSNLKENNYSVDIVLTHTCCSKLADDLSVFKYPCATGKFFDFIEDKVSYKKWYFGHFHMDKEMGKHTCVYNGRPLRIC